MPGAAPPTALSTGRSDEWLVSPADGKSMWRTAVCRIANYGVESVPIAFPAPPQFGEQVSITIPKGGDLLASLWLEVKLTKLDNRLYDDAGAPLYCRGNYYPAEALVKDVSVWLGGQLLDRHTCDWMRVFDSVHRPPEAAEHYKRLTNFDAATVTSAVATTETLYLPLIFSFCRHPGLALPLCAMWGTNVRVVFTFATAREVGVSPSGFDATLYADFVYLDSPEKARFMANRHEYLVEQTQVAEFVVPPGSSGFTADLNFYNSVKCLYWVLRDSTQPTPERSNYARYVGDFDNTFLGFQPAPGAPSGLGLVHGISERLSPVRSVRILLDGQDRFNERAAAYFNKVQPAQHSRRCPLPGIGMFSFALAPERLQVTGLCNFDRFREKQLVLTLKRSTSAGPADAQFEGANAETLATSIDAMTDLRVFALGYNRLVVADGVATLVYNR